MAADPRPPLSPVGAEAFRIGAEAMKGMRPSLSREALEDITDRRPTCGSCESVDLLNTNGEVCPDHPEPWCVDCEGEWCPRCTAEA